MGLQTGKKKRKKKARFWSRVILFIGFRYKKKISISSSPSRIDMAVPTTNAGYNSASLYVGDLNP
jgi:hypothetical protein